MYLYFEVVLAVVCQKLIEIGGVKEHKIQRQVSFCCKLVIELLECHPCEFGAVYDFHQLLNSFLNHFICFFA